MAVLTMSDDSLCCKFGVSNKLFHIINGVILTTSIPYSTVLMGF